MLLVASLQSEGADVLEVCSRDVQEAALCSVPPRFALKTSVCEVYHARAWQCPTGQLQPRPQGSLCTGASISCDCIQLHCTVLQGLCTE